jgi:uncharacterized membrane protein YphA (DoxX/SURF4 family)
MKKSIIAEVIALWFVILFLYTGVSKLAEYTVFRNQIEESPILKPVAAWIAWFIPLSEFTASVLLFLPRTRLKGLYAALGLMVAFTLYVAALMMLNDHLPCSCGGVIENLSWKGHLIFNAINLGLAFTGVKLQKAAINQQSLITVK